jgi:hypothetical protein
MENIEDNRYKNTIIYIIEHPEIKDVYINFTTQKLSHRRAKHIDQYKKYINDGIGSKRPEYEFFEKPDFTINLLERINAGSIEEAKAKVHFYRKQYKQN